MHLFSVSVCLCQCLLICVSPLSSSFLAYFLTPPPHLLISLISRLYLYWNLYFYLQLFLLLHFSVCPTRCGIRRAVRWYLFSLLFFASFSLFMSGLFVVVGFICLYLLLLHVFCLFIICCFVLLIVVACFLSFLLFSLLCFRSFCLFFLFVFIAGNLFPVVFVVCFSMLSLYSLQYPRYLFGLFACPLFFYLLLFVVVWGFTAVLDVEQQQQHETVDSAVVGDPRLFEWFVRPSVSSSSSLSLLSSHARGEHTPAPADSKENSKNAVLSRAEKERRQAATLPPSLRKSISKKQIRRELHAANSFKTVHCTYAPSGRNFVRHRACVEEVLLHACMHLLPSVISPHVYYCVNILWFVCFVSVIETPSEPSLS